ncbi:phage filamentation protein Fil family protein [Yersinia enterocolitica]|uniref:phage filamentation protein Fil family protein n=1 Tax=Yersinia TaxID=629 RepID=UPI0011AADF36|nr:phage filamentation protein Fil family protein [Yersinia aldovae]EKN3441743.1 DUF2724 domain-containing protein [Yersinia enterocolitica]EKN4794956.1 DUF2724 domain-containing protein [Yersinia enterocolitica]EKN5108737.1 DUF2724 domain-containing protein [Yersinia enterocolitica]HDL6708088.1 DUF2724 domain-containing protein [Yersinia enterocolitica]HEI6832775.1 DUF2724 domain-containing protein [Yersinia enterocolitica]
MVVSIAPLLKKQNPVTFRHFGHGMLELKNGQRWKPGSNQKALLQELSSAKKTPILRRLFGR